MPTSSIDSSAAAPGRAAALAELTALLPGQVDLPGDPGWDMLRRGWSPAVDQQPAAFVTIEEEEDVVAAVRWAKRHAFAVTAQPFGHGASAALDGSVLLGTRGLSSITVELARSVARVGSGATWSELLAATSGVGITGLAGSAGDTSVVGHALDGGLSWFGRKYGLAAHRVVAVDLVNAAGQLRRVTPGVDRDLFWALRGGGGDFGIVTAMEIELHSAPPVHGGRMLWPLASARPVLRAFRDLTEAAPEELTLWARLLRFTDRTAVPETLRDGSFVSIDVTLLGTAEETDVLLAPLRRLPEVPVQDSIGPVALADLGDICAEPVEPQPMTEFSRLMNGLTDDTIDALLAAVTDGPDLRLDVVQVRHLGGALARDVGASGPAGAIVEPYHLLGLGSLRQPEDRAAVNAGFSTIASALTKSFSRRRVYSYLTGNYSPAVIFDIATLARLRLVKQAVDPAGVIRSNRPVSVPTSLPCDRQG